MEKLRRCVVLVLAVLLLVSAPAVSAEQSGKYLDPLQFEALPNGRTVKLLKGYRFRAPDKMMWSVPKGWVVDGATIPQYAYSFVGGPLDQKYRDASVIHDYYCDVNTRSWKETHRVFYDAMLSSGVGAIKAKIMYYAVYTFGPRWDTLRKGRFKQECRPDGSACEVRQLVGEAPTIYYATPILEGDQRNFEEAVAAISAKPMMSLNEIEKLGDEQLGSRLDDRSRWAPPAPTISPFQTD